MRYKIRPMIEGVVKRIEERLTAVGLSAAKASMRAGLSKDAIRNIQRMVKNPNPSRQSVTTKTITALAPVLETTPSYLLEGAGDDVPEPKSTVPLVGFVGAGAQANFFAEGQGPFDQVDAPPKKTEHTVAVEVKGDSMPNAAEDGWLLYYDDVHNPILPEMVGRKTPVVVGLDNGKVLVKRVRTGTLPDHYHLYSTDPNEDPIINARVEWAARITWIKPRWND